MDYTKFKEMVAEHILEYLPDSYADAEVSVQTVIKNNSVHLDGLTIRDPGSNICPNIYLNQYFEQYEDGRSFDDIMSELASVRMRSCENPFPEISDLSYLEKIKGKIHAKLVNRSRNEEYLHGKPFTPVADLAVIYYIEMNQSEYGNASVVITDDILDIYGISVSELHAIALTNMQGKKAQFLSMADMLKSMMPEFDDTIDQADVPMYVLTNSEKHNGAAMLLDVCTMDHIAKRIGMSFYILPSSIHETIFVPASITDSNSLDSIVEMVVEINGSQVAPEEVLSNHVYRYDYSTHTLEIAA